MIVFWRLYILEVFLNLDSAVTTQKLQEKVAKVPKNIQTDKLRHNDIEAPPNPFTTFSYP